jgi:hypothetical protein
MPIRFLQWWVKVQQIMGRLREVASEGG